MPPSCTENLMKTRSSAQIKNYMQVEVDAGFLYETLAKLEVRPEIAKVYRSLAKTEKQHAQYWGHLLKKTSLRYDEVPPSKRARILAWLATKFGTSMILPTLVELEQGFGTASRTTAPLAGHEDFHGTVLKNLQSMTSGGLEGNVIAGFEGRHRTIGGNALRAAVLGANDGLVSNLALVMGVAGATNSNSSALIAGSAGLLAGAISMALGEWLSVQSARELHVRQMDIEEKELRLHPEEEGEELSLIYQAKGMSEAEANKLAKSILADPELALKTLAVEELGINPDDLGGSAWEAAFTSFFLFAFGAFIPIAPLLIPLGNSAVITSVLLSSLALFGIGTAITLMTGRSVLFSGARQMLFGLVAAGVTYGLGYLLGVNL